ncbi:MAG: hypothetical protein C7B44_07230 [Sulfobacillus thermosulfidooxidans]|nr:MAG: hypothetical protein C7B44_07230 [Sulfobacillus thermosulfidooxidans]
MALSSHQIILYAADDNDFSIALAAAAVSGIPACQVTGNFFDAWIYTSSGEYLVIAVGGPANNALYYNPCGWPNPDQEPQGTTPFDIAPAPRDTLPGANWYVNASGNQAYQTLELATCFTYFAVHASLPSGITPPPAISPMYICGGSSNISCVCSLMTPLPPTGLYYGADLGTNQFPPINACGMTFYIGQMGGGLNAGTSTTCGYTVFGNFSTLAAQAALNNKGAMYGEWFLLGPAFYNGCVGASSQDEAYQWGMQQANAAVTALAQFPEINRRTIFTDVEPGSWSTNTSLNQAVILGFLAQIKQRGHEPGVYSSPCFWQEITASMMLPCGTVTWTAEFSYAAAPACPSHFIPQPYAPCPSPYVGPQAFGGILPNIWQYYESDTVDWDVANALPD